MVSLRLAATCLAPCTLASKTERPRSLGTIATVIAWPDAAGDADDAGAEAADDDAGAEAADDDAAGAELAGGELVEELDTEQPASTTAAAAGSAANTVSRCHCLDAGRPDAGTGILLDISSSFGRY